MGVRKHTETKRKKKGERKKNEERMTGGGGGGCGTSICILGTCRARDPHFKPWSALHFRSGLSFSQISPKSVPEHHHLHFWPDFAVPETIIFKICFGVSPFYTFWRTLPFRRLSFSEREAFGSAAG